MAKRGGVDLGGTKIQVVVVDDKHEVLGQARRPTPTTGTPADVKDAIAAALVEAADAAGIKTAELSGIGVGSPGEIDAGHRRRLAGAQPAGLGRHATRWPKRWPRPAARRSRSATTCRSPPTPSSSSARARTTGRSSACSGAPGSAAGSCSTASRGSGAALPARSATSSSASTARAARAGAAAAWRPTPAGRRWRPRRAREVAKGRKTELFEIMEERGRERLTSGIWARAARRRRTRSRSN